MVEVDTAMFEGQRCDHRVTIDFVGREDEIWDSKTMGCPDCGLTGTFVRVGDNVGDKEMIIHDDDSDLAPSDSESEEDATGPSESGDSDENLAPNEDEGDEEQDSEEQNNSIEDEVVSPEELSEELASATDSTPEEIEDGVNELEIAPIDEATVVEQTDVSLEELSYRELQSVAVETDIRGNQKQDVLIQDLRESAADIQSIIEDVVGDDNE